jgi:branched-chain amino acid transport system substrate-binding protein
MRPTRTRSRRSPRQLRHVGLCSAVIIAAGALALVGCGSSGGNTASPQSPSSGGANGASGASGTPIKIGSIGGYSGTYGHDFSAEEDALLAWSKDVDAKGGIHGHPVEVITKDDQSDPVKSVVAVKDLIENDHVVALVSNKESGVDGSWATYVDGKHVPVVGGDGTGIAYYTDPNFFPVGNTGVAGYSSYVKAALLNGKTSYSEVYCAEQPACKQAESLSAYFTKTMGIKGIAGLGISESSTSYVAQCEKLSQAGANAVFVATARVPAERFIQECRGQGYSPLFIDSPQNWEASATTNPVWNGAVLASDAPLWFGDGPGTAEYLAAMKKYEPSAVLNSNGTNGWYSAKVLEAAIDKAYDNGATGPVTSQTVYDGLYALGPNFDLGGIVAPVTYSKGKAAVQQLCGWYAQVKDGKLVAIAAAGYGRLCLNGVQPPSLASLGS